MNRSLIKVALWDVLPPVAAYYALRALGVNEHLALLGASLTGFVRAAHVGIRERRLDGFAAFMCLIFGLGLALAFLTGDERFMLAVKSATTGVMAVVLVATCAAGHPAAYGMAKRFGADDAATAARWDVLYEADPKFRRVYMVMTLTWAAALVTESVVRIPLIYLLPVDIMAGLSSALLIGTLTLVAAWSAWYGRRGEQAATAHHQTT
ncbi:VC0807 family protein [Nonomuraea sp. NPDC003709]|uniref:VC0807 family protein n=1 Tax=Nonomuraea sp. NPDC003709 TaxID=3154450 RepID=UPI0033AC9808